MSAATAGRDAKRSEGKLKAYPIAASTTIYKDTLVGLNSSGYLVSMSDAASLKFVGVAFEGIVNSGSAGDKKCRVWEQGEFEFAYAGGDAAQSIVGSLVYAQDNQTVDEDASLTTNDYPVGIIVEVISVTKVRVYVAKHLRVAGTVATGDVADSAITTAKLAANNVTAAKVTATMRTGYIPLPLALAREMSSNDFINTAGDAGVLSKNTTPILERINGATDKKARIAWAASNSDEIVWDITYPPDLDDTAAVTVKFIALMAGATDTPVVAVSYFEGVGDTNAGGNSGALSAAAQTLSVAIAAADVGAAPNAASIGFVPGAHTTDALYLLGAWLEYTRK
jgi:hypothetical protein